MGSPGAKGSQTEPATSCGAIIESADRPKAASVLQATGFRRDLTVFHLNAPPRPKTFAQTFAHLT
jgi:hypothetical protein